VETQIVKDGSDRTVQVLGGLKKIGGEVVQAPNLRVIHQKQVIVVHEPPLEGSSVNPKNQHGEYEKAGAPFPPQVFARLWEIHTIGSVRSGGRSPGGRVGIFRSDVHVFRGLVPKSYITGLWKKSSFFRNGEFPRPNPPSKKRHLKIGTFLLKPALSPDYDFSRYPKFWRIFKGETNSWLGVQGEGPNGPVVFNF
jgi:hypothetical protein